MIDFRYHLVSLVAVFLALAVGIVLGAGPLAQPIGETLTGQVDRLREDRNALSNQLTESKEKLATSEQVANAFADRIFDHVLSGVNVALVVLPGADGEDVKNVNGKITQAGGVISAQINLREEFFSPAKKAYREALSGQIAQYLEDTSRATTPESTLAAAVGQLVFTGENEALTGILSVADTPLLQVVTPAKTPARVGVVIGPRSDKTKAPANRPETPDKKDKNPEPGYLELAHTLNSFAGGIVIFGAALKPTDLISVVRTEANPVPTLDGIGTASALLTLPFTLVASINGKAEAWGTGMGATALVPDLDLKVAPAPPQPAPTNPGQSGVGDAPQNPPPPHENPGAPAA